MKFPKSSRYLRTVGLTLGLLACIALTIQRIISWGQPTVQFEDFTRQVGLLRYTPSFAAVVTDFDGDGLDDIFVGHHGYPPTLYLNRNLNFVEAADAVPITNRDDRHGYTFVDFDNDGDKDFVYAGGGADGLGKGTANEVYQNLLVEMGTLKFINVSGESDIAYPTWRSRAFLPIPNAAGDRVDLYLTSLHEHREGSTNLYVVNNSIPGSIRLEVDDSSSLHQRFESEGSDLFFDFDRDGLMDFLRLGQMRASLYKNHSGSFRHLHSALDKVRDVISAVPADLNNDSYPDLYIGASSGYTGSDYIGANGTEIHFTIRSQNNKDILDRIAFRTSTGQISIDFVEHISALGRTRTDASDIYIGERMKNPKRRSANIRRRQATGQPGNFEKPGIYIWFDSKSELWHVQWQHEEKVSNSKGIIAGEGVEVIAQDDMEIFPPKQVRDYILINQRGNGWDVLELPELKHDAWTNYLTAADFNNDGFIDIVGVRTSDGAGTNGTPFILLNHGGLKFSRQEILANVEDDIFHADIIVHGFFNDDGLADLFYTNGYGLLPGHKGPYQFWLNTTTNANGHLLLEIEGTRANRDAIGAQVELYSANDKLLGYREIGSGYGRGQNTHKIHFGLGTASGPFRLQVRWPGEDQAQQILLPGTGYYHLRQAP